jgi:HAD superfamily hydrolase (TIGR01509 family)
MKQGITETALGACVAAAGNTVIVVEHELRVIAASDWVIDVGAGAGAEGGRIVASGTPMSLVADPKGSRTAPYLAPLLSGGAWLGGRPGSRRRRWRAANSYTFAGVHWDSVRQNSVTIATTRMHLTLEAALLDIDGTLLDSNDAHAESWLVVLRKFGYERTFAQVRPLIGKGADKLMPELIGVGPDDPAFKRISEQRTALFLSDFLGTLRPTPGARPLLERMKAEGLRLVVATSAGSELPALLRQAGVADLIDLSTTSEDAESSKPDADIVHAALAKSGVAAARAVMLGDTPFDIQAARAAGVACIALRCGGWWKDADLAGAAALYADPAEFLSKWPGPLGARGAVLHE